MSAWHHIENFAHESYTVGWICALSIELAAAATFLDEKHGGPTSVPPNDNNSYTLGRIGEHNGVIVVLPKGGDMVHTFPNVRIGLMVGVGGGAPSRRYGHDIRLGDIVVSAPYKTGGVFQYDFGHAIQNQRFRTTGFLNQPPTVLRTAMNTLEAEHETYGHQLTMQLTLFWRITHPENDESSCAKVCGDDPSKLIYRRQRDEDEDNPVIHYGVIALANTLMKDANIRYNLIKEKEVLCFEMEAAGLMNHLPCLVIRGICDYYSDSHKNKEWQGYAAMTAAAYAKAILFRIAPNQVEAEKRIADIS
ncbi:purine and uridine phosphorylase [Eremomyces bilateralis CBS 781.70]|uniref:Purine and uridine phosphorylase n=1 Tax=Eremomyces bilateralis CBS 781.70 TaxID=1392243 RepID=A0A6G1G8A5_9PEZI|nr:purine and uridine phosphorylase [Eremomyces bilateralis CBS 781.70]KAF1814297.1 purine and uridine phosphorylase [Eremomyces bilateralis CBS 781.70]